MNVDYLNETIKVSIGGCRVELRAIGGEGRDTFVKIEVETCS